MRTGTGEEQKGLKQILNIIFIIYRCICIYIYIDTQIRYLYNNEETFPCEA